MAWSHPELTREKGPCLIPVQPPRSDSNEKLPKISPLFHPVSGGSHAAGTGEGRLWERPGAARRGFARTEAGVAGGSTHKPLGTENGDIHAQYAARTGP